MSRNEHDFHERDPHYDGRYEGITNDSLSSTGDQMGIKMDMDLESSVRPKNPFHLNPKVDKDMQKFESFFEGEKPKKAGE